MACSDADCAEYSRPLLAVRCSAPSVAWRSPSFSCSFPGGTLTISPRFPGAAFIVPTVWFAAIGALSGGVFGTLLMLAERGHRVAELRPYRMAIWAAVPTALALRFFGGASWTLVALGTGVAAGIGAAATVLAKRGGEPAMTGFDSDADERRAP